MAFVNASMQRITYGHPLLINPFLLQDTLVNVASVSTQRIERLEPFSIEEPVLLENDMSVSYFRPRADRIVPNYIQYKSSIIESTMVTSAYCVS